MSDYLSRHKRRSTKTKEALLLGWDVQFGLTLNYTGNLLLSLVVVQVYCQLSKSCVVKFTINCST